MAKRKLDGAMYDLTRQDKHPNDLHKAASKLSDDEPLFECGVALRGELDDPHRTGMSEQEARTWISEWEEMGGQAEAMQLIRRQLSPWSVVA